MDERMFFNSRDAAELTDGFLSDMDEDPVDMEQIREGMKLVPLPEMYYAGDGLTSMNRFELESSLGDDGGELEKPLDEAEKSTRSATHSTLNDVDDGPPPDFSLWTVEDDLLLKSAIEAGAAMEALAKGAMRFSRRYTVRELRERWRALLYDPEISSKAAARMVQAEAAFLESMRLMFPSEQKFHDFVQKRRQKSVRATYYKAKKCVAADKSEQEAEEDDAFSQMVSLLATGGVKAVIGDADGVDENEKAPGDFDETAREILSPGKAELPDTSDGHPDTPQEQQACDTEQPNFPTGDTVSHDTDKILTRKKPNGKEKETLPQDTEASDPKSDPSVPVDKGTPDSGLKCKVDQDACESEHVRKSQPEILVLSSDEEVEYQDSEYSRSPSPKRPRVQEQLTCTFNTEETEVPALDDFLLGSSPSSPRQQAPASPEEDTSYFSSPKRYQASRQSFDYQNIRGVEMPREDRHLSLPSDNLCFKISLTGKRGISFDQSRGKAMAYQAEPSNPSLQLSSMRIPQPSPQLRRTSEIARTSSLGQTMPIPPPTSISAPALDTEVASNWKADSEAGAAMIDSALKDADTPERPEIESDDEIADFSDVEAMILDMDLDPGDDDVSARAESKRVFRQHRRTLLRLEQAANASMQRALFLRGAIAVLYGHKLKYFITKDEVSVGRATEENTVDIDLVQEGAANKVSRKQASIKLKEDGTFYLKNIGRRILRVNNVAVDTGQHIGLTSNCLIEVGGMRFIFEMNRKLTSQRVKEMLQAAKQNAGV